MKKFLLALIAVTAIGLAGCQSKTVNTDGIKDEMTSAISAKQYDRAAGLNQAILKLDDSDKDAAKRADQFTQLLKAQKQFDQNNFTSAQTTASKVESGNAQLTQVANQLETLAKKRAQQQATLKKQLKTAKSLSDSEPSAAQAKVESILSSSMIKLTAFRSIRIQVLQLQNQLLSNASSSTSSSDNTQASANSTSSTTDTSASSSSTQPEGQPISGSEDITDADIAKARQEIKATGENPDYFSDNDVRSAIIKARAAGRTVVQSSDWQ